MTSIADLPMAELRLRLKEALAVHAFAPSPGRAQLIDELEQELNQRGDQLALPFAEDTER